MGPQEDYVETVVTCVGDYYDPEFPSQLRKFRHSLQKLLFSDSRKLIVKKVEPWNSVRVTFNIPKEAAQRLQQLAQQGDHALRELGILAVQVEGDQIISLTIAGRNNERTELVFRTSGSASSSTHSQPGPSSSFSSADESSVPGPNHSEATRKNIAHYLSQQGATSVFDSLFRGNEPEVFKSPNVVAPHGNPLPFRQPLPSHQPMNTGGAVGAFNFTHGRPPPGYPANIASPSGSPPRQLNPSATLPPGVQQPTMHPYQRLPQAGRRGLTSSSPLLVNLLQADLSAGHVNNFQSTQMSELFFSEVPHPVQAPKKRRKSRKSKDGSDKRSSSPGSAATSPGQAEASRANSSSPRSSATQPLDPLQQRLRDERIMEAINTVAESAYRELNNDSPTDNMDAKYLGQESSSEKMSSDSPVSSDAFVNPLVRLPGEFSESRGEQSVERTCSEPVNQNSLESCGDQPTCNSMQTSHGSEVLKNVASDPPNTAQAGSAVTVSTESTNYGHITIKVGDHGGSRHAPEMNNLQSIAPVTPPAEADSSPGGNGLPKYLPLKNVVGDGNLGSTDDVPALRISEQSTLPNNVGECKQTVNSESGDDIKNSHTDHDAVQSNSVEPYTHTRIGDIQNCTLTSSVGMSPQSAGTASSESPQSTPLLSNPEQDMNIVTVGCVLSDSSAPRVEKSDWPMDIDRDLPKDFKSSLLGDLRSDMAAIVKSGLDFPKGSLPGTEHLENKVLCGDIILSNQTDGKANSAGTCGEVSSEPCLSSVKLTVESKGAGSESNETCKMETQSKDKIDPDGGQKIDTTDGEKNSPCSVVNHEQSPMSENPSPNEPIPSAGNMLSVGDTEACDIISDQNEESGRLDVQPSKELDVEGYKRSVNCEFESTLEVNSSPAMPSGQSIGSSSQEVEPVESLPSANGGKLVNSCGSSDMNGRSVQTEPREEETPTTRPVPSADSKLLDSVPCSNLSNVGSVSSVPKDTEKHPSSTDVRDVGQVGNFPEPENSVADESVCSSTYPPVDGIETSTSVCECSALDQPETITSSLDTSSFNPVVSKVEESSSIENHLLDTTEKDDPVSCQESVAIENKQMDSAESESKESTPQSQMGRECSVMEVVNESHVQTSESSTNHITSPTNDVVKSCQEKSEEPKREEASSISASPVGEPLSDCSDKLVTVERLTPSSVATCSLEDTAAISSSKGDVAVSSSLQPEGSGLDLICSQYSTDGASEASPLQQLQTDEMPLSVETDVSQMSSSDCDAHKSSSNVVDLPMCHDKDVQSPVQDEETIDHELVTESHPNAEQCENGDRQVRDGNISSGTKTVESVPTDNALVSNPKVAAAEPEDSLAVAKNCEEESGITDSGKVSSDDSATSKHRRKSGTKGISILKPLIDRNAALEKEAVNESDSTRSESLPIVIKVGQQHSSKPSAPSGAISCTSAPQPTTTRPSSFSIDSILDSSGHSTTATMKDNIHSTSNRLHSAKTPAVHALDNTVAGSQPITAAVLSSVTSNMLNNSIDSMQAMPTTYSRAPQQSSIHLNFLQKSLHTPPSVLNSYSGPQFATKLTDSIRGVVKTDASFVHVVKPIASHPAAGIKTGIVQPMVISNMHHQQLSPGLMSTKETLSLVLSPPLRLSASGDLSPPLKSKTSAFSVPGSVCEQENTAYAPRSIVHPPQLSSLEILASAARAHAAISQQSKLVSPSSVIQTIGNHAVNKLSVANDSTSSLQISPSVKQAVRKLESPILKEGSSSVKVSADVTQVVNRPTEDKLPTVRDSSLSCHTAPSVIPTVTNSEDELPLVKDSTLSTSVKEVMKNAVENDLPAVKDSVSSASISESSVAAKAEDGLLQPSDQQAVSQSEGSKSNAVVCNGPGHLTASASKRKADDIDQHNSTSSQSSDVVEVPVKRTKESPVEEKDGSSEKKSPEVNHNCVYTAQVESECGNAGEVTEQLPDTESALHGETPDQSDMDRSEDGEVDLSRTRHDSSESTSTCKSDRDEEGTRATRQSNKYSEVSPRNGRSRRGGAKLSELESSATPVRSSTRSTRSRVSENSPDSKNCDEKKPDIKSNSSANSTSDNHAPDAKAPRASRNAKRKVAGEEANSEGGCEKKNRTEEDGESELAVNTRNTRGGKSNQRNNTLVKEAAIVERVGTRRAGKKEEPVQPAANSNAGKLAEAEATGGAASLTAAERRSTRSKGQTDLVALPNPYRVRPPKSKR